MARKAREKARPTYIEAFSSAEHQAKVFASEFLMPAALTSSCASPDDIERRFGVSAEAARVCFDGVTRARRRSDLAVKMRQLSSELGRGEKKGQSSHYLLDACLSCKQQKLIPIGVKIFCESCGAVSDGYQDGDVQSF